MSLNLINILRSGLRNLSLLAPRAGLPRSHPRRPAVGEPTGLRPQGSQCPGAAGQPTFIGIFTGRPGCASIADWLNPALHTFLFGLLGVVSFLCFVVKFRVPDSFGEKKAEAVIPLGS